MIRGAKHKARDIVEWKEASNISPHCARAKRTGCDCWVGPSWAGVLKMAQLSQPPTPNPCKRQPLWVDNWSCWEMIMGVEGMGVGAVSI